MNEIKFIKTQNLRKILSFYPLILNTFPYLQKKITKEYFEAKIQNRFGMIIEAKQNDKTIGFSIWFEENPTLAYIWWMIVLPEWQNKGIGKRLFEMSLNEIKKRGYHKVWAKVKHDNFAALLLLLKYQFYIKGISNEDEVLTLFMEKNLTSFC